MPFCKMNSRLSVSLAKMLLSSAIYSGLYYDLSFNNKLCGPLAIPPNPAFLMQVIIIEMVSAMYPLAMKLMEKIGLFNEFLSRLSCMYSAKYFIVLILKLWIIFGQEHRIKYYFHTGLIEFTIIFFSALTDIAANSNISEVWEIIVTDSFNKIALFYEITRTFCPNFALYWFATNLLVLAMSQIEAHIIEDESKVPKNQPLYKTSLYVKQDIQKILIVTLTYLGLFAVVQINLYGYGMLIAFGLSAYPLYKTIFNIEDNSRLKQSVVLLFLICSIFVLLAAARIVYPSAFKALEDSTGEGQCAVYHDLLTA